MEEQKKSLTLNGMTGPNFLFILNAVAMIGVGIYLTTHFYSAVYPTNMREAASACNINAFFNCDGATHSKIAQVAGVPTGFFGVVMGILFLFTSLMPSVNAEKTASALAKINFLGCIALFIFSIAVLGTLCPFCSIYYVLSGIACFLLWKYGMNTWKPELKNLAVWGVLLLVGGFFMNKTTAEKEDAKNKINASIIEQFRNLATVGDPDQESPYKINMGTEKFDDGPIRISVFSDFECPSCKAFSDQLPEQIRRYGKKINIQYFFYPLDSKCNSNVKSRLHENACDAAAVAACDVTKFHAVHDEIFANQEKLRSGALASIAEKNGLQGCLANSENMNKVIALINGSTKYGIKSTPTIIVNGKKIEGALPNSMFFAIYDDILAGAK